jgi:putative ABC transport system substrate-binding protein
MRRREFITLVGGAAAWPLAARSQEARKLPTIGFMGSDAAFFSPWTAAFAGRLRELGWVEGRTISIEYRWSEGRPERVDAIAAEFVGLNVDVIVTAGGAAAAFKRATSVIPIVFAVATDPLGSGLVDSLARPGGNVTGLSNLQAELAGKRLELLREFIPRLRRVAVMANVGYPSAVLEMGEVQTAVQSLGLEFFPLEIRRAADIVPAFDGRAEAVYVVGDALINANLTRILILAAGAHLPTIFNSRDYVRAGGLISYGPSFPAMFRRAAELVDKILRGTKPGDIPVEQPTKFEFVLNLTTAKAIRLDFPESLVLRADEVIE